MDALERHQLLWLTDTAWEKVQQRDWDPQESTVLAHWREQRLPVVVTLQRGDVPLDLVCVGLPAPTQWARRKLAFTISENGILTQAKFPTLAQISHDRAWCLAALDLQSALAPCKVRCHVHGSYGWQHLTGLSYLHAESDLDLSLGVTHFEQAVQVVALLDKAQLPPRLDGELAFPGNQAVAWRELLQLFHGKVSQVLVKNRFGVALVDAAHLRALCHEVSP